MNNKGADQTARMRRLVCACVVKKNADRFSCVKAHMVSKEIRNKIYLDLMPFNSIINYMVNSLCLIELIYGFCFVFLLLRYPLITLWMTLSHLN